VIINKSLRYLVACARDETCKVQVPFLRQIMFVCQVLNSKSVLAKHVKCVPYAKERIPQLTSRLCYVNYVDEREIIGLALRISKAGWCSLIV